MSQHNIQSRTRQHLICRKATEEATRNSEALSRAISDASPLGIYVSDWAGWLRLFQRSLSKDIRDDAQTDSGHELEQDDSS